VSDEYSIAGNFKTGKISAPEYERKMERLGFSTVAIEDDANEPLRVQSQGRMLSDGTMFTIHYWPHKRACAGLITNHGG
jgi:hypothetical protein